MPELGDRTKGMGIGKKATHIFIFFACPGCGYARWVQPVQIHRSKGRCYKCAGLAKRGKPNTALCGSANAAWKGGRILLKTGYIRVRLMPNDPLCGMGIGNGKGHLSRYVLEHRLIMARHLGRCLESWEVVHHKNGDKADNRIENLELLPGRQSHMAFNILQSENSQLRERIQALEARMTLLEAERVLERV